MLRDAHCGVIVDEVQDVGGCASPVRRMSPLLCEVAGVEAPFLCGVDRRIAPAGGASAHDQVATEQVSLVVRRLSVCVGRAILRASVPFAPQGRADAAASDTDQRSR